MEEDKKGPRRKEERNGRKSSQRLSRGREKLGDKAKELETKIEPRLLQSFKRIRKNSRNGLGIVYVQRDACGGCFNLGIHLGAIGHPLTQENHRLRILRPYHD